MDRRVKPGGDEEIFVLVTETLVLTTVPISVTFYA
jgi:hypothetical protein